MDVALIRWPSDEALPVELAQIKHPRLLLVEPHADPPHISDILEDWVSLPVSREDRNARIKILESRVSRGLPHVGDDGILHYRGSSTRLSVMQAHLMRAFIERFGAVVSRDTLMASAWPDGDATASNSRVMVTRLRPLLAPLDLQIRAVRSRGYLLTASDIDPDRRQSSTAVLLTTFSASRNTAETEPRNDAPATQPTPAGRSADGYW
jgi:DNA-binding winged helix-turn-helix (wHTH) protein